MRAGRPSGHGLLLMAPGRKPAPEDGSAPFMAVSRRMNGGRVCVRACVQEARGVTILYLRRGLLLWAGAFAFTVLLGTCFISARVGGRGCLSVCVYVCVCVLCLFLCSCMFANSLSMHIYIALCYINKYIFMGVFYALKSISICLKGYSRLSMQELAILGECSVNRMG